MIIELRRYRIRRGERERFLRFFAEKAVPAQEKEGMSILGYFIDLEDDDVVVWLRAFPDLASRDVMKKAFYEGESWKEALEDEAMSMVEDYSDVTLLEPGPRSRIR